MPFIKLSEKLLTMLKQEQTLYDGSCCKCCITTAVASGIITNNEACFNRGPIRYKIVHWCKEVVKFCKLQNAQRCVEYAMNYADRYCQSCSSCCCCNVSSVTNNNKNNNIMNEYQYKLLVMTCMYISIKIHSNTVITTNDIHKLSKYIYTVKEIEVMEIQILKTLQWKMNPPIAFEFAYEYIRIITMNNNNEQQQQQLSMKVLNDIYKDATRRIINGIQFRGNVQSSHIAYYSVLAALEKENIITCKDTVISIYKLLQQYNQQQQLSRCNSSSCCSTLPVSKTSKNTTVILCSPKQRDNVVSIRRQNNEKQQQNGTTKNNNANTTNNNKDNSEERMQLENSSSSSSSSPRSSLILKDSVQFLHKNQIN